MKKTGKSELASKIMAYGATAASLLAVAQPAAAAIIFSGTQNLPFNTNNSPVSVDLNSDGTFDFRFSNTISTSNSIISDWWQSIVGVGETGAEGQFIAGTTVANNYDPLRLEGAYNIKATLGANMEWDADYNTLAGNTSTGGNFNNTNGYIGVRFHSNVCQGNDWHYGWIHFTNAGTLDSTIDSWAYESTCNTQIPAGAQAPVEPTSVPTLDQWGMLIMAGLLSGAAIFRMRKDQKEA